MPRAICLRVARRAAALAIAVGLSACASATEPEVVELPDIQNVRITFDSMTVVGSCDHNSFFEDAADGEFRFAVTVGDTRSTTVDLERTLIATLQERSYKLPSTWRTVVRKDVSSDPVIHVQFWATETDGLLGADPDMANRNRSETHRWSGTKWTGNRSIALIKSIECGVAVRYSITSTPVE